MGSSKRITDCPLRVCQSLALNFLLLAIIGAHGQTISPAESRPGFSGDAACASCHTAHSSTYIHTSHHLTSQTVTNSSVKGSFTEGSNTLTIIDPARTTAEPGLYFKMERMDSGYYQTAVTGWDSQLEMRSERMDLMTGSGVRGATYLYWQGDRLFELPVSYWTNGHQWINSPGYENGTANFTRPVNPGCLECHTSFIRPLSSDPSTNRYDRGSLVTGITCEYCHGPGMDHIAQRRKGAASKAGAAILNPATFSRDRQVDLCALCHNGIQREATSPAFSYVPGRPLSEYFKPLAAPTSDRPDVHGNQVGLLQRSRCYISSPQMSCSTCHDVHSAERSAATYSQRCLTCHRWQNCGVSKKLGRAITKNCIDCHMPVQPTNVIVSETGEKTLRASMRNHWIKVYPSASRQTASH